MTGAQTLAARAALGGFAAAASFAALSFERFRTGAARRFDRLVTSAFVLSRFGLFVLVFFLLHIPVRGDVVGFYMPEALKGLGGALPYRDFPSSYAPLHPYLDAALIAVWRSPLVIILFAIVVEAFLLPAWLKLARRLFPEDQVRAAALLYVASPISLQFVTIDGQDNVIIALLLALGTLCLYKGRAFLSGLLVAVGVGLVKFLALLYFPLFWIASRNRMRWLIGAAVALLATYLPFVLLRLPLLYPLRFEGQARTASNVPYIVESVLGMALPGWLEDGLLLVVVVALLAFIGRAVWQAELQVRLRAVTFGSAALTLALLLLSKKSWPPYLMLVLFPLCLLVSAGRDSRLRVLGFCVFSLVAILAHSVWATVFAQFLAPAFHLSLLSGQTAPWVFLFLQICLLAGYAWLLVEAALESLRSRPVLQQAGSATVIRHN